MKESFVYQLGSIRNFLDVECFDRESTIQGHQKEINWNRSHQIMEEVFTRERTRRV